MQLDDNDLCTFSGKMPCPSHLKKEVTYELVTKPWSLSSCKSTIDFLEKKEVFRTKCGHLFRPRFLEDVFTKIQQRIVHPRELDKTLPANFKTNEAESANSILKRQLSHIQPII